jgi:hypothetical protein
MHLVSVQQVFLGFKFTLFVVCLFDLLFDPENGGDMFLRNFGWLSTDYTALYPRRQNYPGIIFEKIFPLLAVSLPLCADVLFLLQYIMSSVTVYNLGCRGLAPRPWVSASITVYET